MVVPQETIQKMSHLSADDMSIITQLIDQMTMSPKDVFRNLRKQGVEKNLSEEEIDDFVDSVKVERYAASCN